ncbi:hypothetical protein ASA1KI_23600 [Opitutales bacterium ASA1]|nr:hypothetical protein ASA1KI_23600 [Opitutales bacterium ASA1]
MFFKAVYPASEGVALEWTGTYASGDPVVAAGTIGTAFQEAVRVRVNFLRALAGVPADIVFDDAYSAKAQQAAMMMSVNNALSHTPPDSWQLYTADGYLAASKSNLALGLHGPSAVNGYVADPGSSNAAVGHRRWLLHPQARTMGTGDVPGQGNAPKPANALWVLDGNTYAPRPFVRESFVAWPSPGYAPYQLVWPRWSISYPNANFAGATVTMTRDGAPMNVVLEPIASGYGENTLVWVPDQLDTNSMDPHGRPEVDVTYTVHVAGVVVGGQTQTFSYDVIVFDPERVGPDTEDVVPVGPADVFVGEVSNYSMGGLYYATGFQWRTLVTETYDAVEGAENGTAGLIVSTTGTYPVVRATPKVSGSAAFHLAHETGADQSIEIDRDFLASSVAQLAFQSRLGTATAQQVARVQVSTDDGRSWADVYSQAGAGQPGESSFQLRTIDLATLSGRTFRVRFAYTFDVGSYYPQTSAGVGWHFDDIVLSGVQSVTASNPSATQTGTQLAFTPTAAGTHVLQARGVFQEAYPLEWGPAKSVTASVATPTAPVFLVHPESRSVDPGANVTFNVSVTGVPTPTLQWTKDGVAIPGATGSSLSLLLVGAQQAGVYAVVATNSEGSATSTAATLVVQSVPEAPTILAQPAGAARLVGQSLSLSVSAIGYPTVGYQWTRDGNPVPGATSATFSVPSATLAHAGVYRVVVSNTEGAVTSDAAIVAVYDPIVITSQPVGVTVAAGTRTTLSVGATGGTPSFQWYAGEVGDTSAPIAGAVSTSFTTPPMDATGRFWVRVSSPAQMVDSVAATVDVEAPVRVFFGTIGNEEGLFALVRRPGGGGVFVGCIHASGTKVFGEVSTFGAGGEFGFESGGAAGAVDGMVAGTGVSGSFSGTGMAFSGAEITTHGAGASLVGLLTAVQVNSSSGEVLIVMGPDDEALVIASSADGWSGALLPVSSQGAITGVLADGRTVSLQAFASTGKVTGTIATTDGSVVIAGARSGYGFARQVDNLSARAQVRQGDGIMIAGFVVAGSGTKTLLLRGIGPTLGKYGVANTLVDPIVRIYRQGEPAGTPPVYENDDWTVGDDNAVLVQATALVGADDLVQGSTDSAMLVELPAGAYTAHVLGKAGGTGAALVEMYDADAALGRATSARLTNISMRSEVGAGDSIVIPGFVVSGSAPKRLLIRGVGDELRRYGVSDALVDTTLHLYRGSTPIASNDDWDAGDGGAEIEAASAFVGADDLAPGSRSAAILIWLEPGAYTVHFAGAAGTTGVGLVEVYELP